jgi:hypothetical protein
MIEKNPIAWLEGRDHLQGRVLWLLILASVIFWTIKHHQSPHNWPDEDALVLWSLMAHITFCMWVAIQAPRRVADDKESGALELILCTPTPAPKIIAGCMKILWRRFGRPFIALMAIDLWLLYLRYSPRTFPPRFWHDDLLQLAACAMIVFPFQIYSLTRIGIYQGLVQSNALRATFVTIGKAWLLPWIAFFVSMLTLELSRQWIKIRLRSEFFLALWGGLHVGICGLFLAHASWKLRRRFRQLASESSSLPWWRRWLRFGRAPKH